MGADHLDHCDYLSRKIESAYFSETFINLKKKLQIRDICRWKTDFPLFLPKPWQDIWKTQQKAKLEADISDPRTF